MEIKTRINVNRHNKILDFLNYKIMDNTPKVTGIGGVFFKTKDPKATRDWYAKHLGLNVNEYGSTFESRDAMNPEKKNYLQWSAFKDDTDYFEPSQKEFMINYRVQNIEQLVENLKAEGVKVIDEIATYSYGKFVHIMDDDGNSIELWEPVDEALVESEDETTK